MLLLQSITITYSSFFILEDLTIISQNELIAKTREDEKDATLNSIISNPAVVLSSLNFQLPIKNYQVSKLRIVMLRIIHLRLKVRNIIKHKVFFWFVIFMVSINTFILATNHYQQPIWLTDVQSK